MIYRVQRRDPDTKRWNKICDFEDRHLAEVAVWGWQNYWIEYGRFDEVRIIELDR